MPLAARTPRTDVDNPTGPPGTALPGLRVDLGPVPFGLVDGYGVEWYVTDHGLAGWFDSPAVVGVTTKRPGDHGGWSGPTTLDMRAITVECRLVAPDTPSRDAALARLYQACPFTASQTLQVSGHPTTQALVRRSGDLLAVFVDPYTVDVTVPLLAPDPRRYAVDVASSSTVLTVPTAGATPPLTPPLVIADEPRGGFVFGTNAGTLDAPWVARIEGPVSGPMLSYPDGGRFIAFDLDLAAGQSLTINSRDRTALLDDQSSRTSTILPGSSWFLLAAGLQYDVRFIGTAVTSTAPALTFTPLLCYS